MDNINPRKADGITPIHAAALHAANDVLWPTICESTKLALALNHGDGRFKGSHSVLAGSVEIVKFLATKVKSLNEPTSECGYTPIFLAAVSGHIDMVKFLISKVENPNASIQVKCASKQDLKSIKLFYMTPMEGAKRLGNRDIVKFFEQYEQYEFFRTTYMVNE